MRFGLVKTPPTEYKYFLEFGLSNTMGNGQMAVENLRRLGSVDFLFTS